MSIEANKLIMRRFTEFINTASEKLATELISPNAIFHVPGRSEPLKGPAGYLAVIGMMRGGSPDIQWTLEEMIAEGDKVAARFTTRGTHKGTFFGVPSTGKKIEVTAMNFYHLAGGQFVEEHGQPDLLGLLQQIGAIPSNQGLEALQMQHRGWPDEVKSQADACSPRGGTQIDPPVLSRLVARCLNVD